MPGTFQANVATLAIGTAGSQLILVAATPILSRIYTPAAFGAFAVTFSLASLLACLGTLRYETAIPLAHTNDEAYSAMKLSIWAIAVASFTSLLIGLAAFVLVDSFEVRIRDNWSLSLIPALAFFMGFWTSVRMLQSRLENFRRIGTTTLVSSFAQVFTQTMAGLVAAGGVGLTMGYIAGKMLNAASLLPRADPSRQPQRIRTVAHKWRSLPIFTMVPAFLNSLSVAAVTPIVSGLYGLAFAGLFGFAQRIVAIPAALIGQAVALVLYPKMAALDRAGTNTAPAIEALSTVLIATAFPTFGFLILLGPEMFDIAFGASWREAGTIAAILSPWLGLNLLSSPLSSYVSVKRKFGLLLVLSILEATVRIAALAVGTGSGSSTAGVAAYSTAGCLVSLAYIVWTFRLAGTRLTIWAFRNGRLLLVGLGFLTIVPALRAVLAPNHYVLISLTAWVLVSLSSLVTILRLKQHSSRGLNA